MAIDAKQYEDDFPQETVIEPRITTNCGEVTLTSYNIIIGCSWG